jgi:lipoprotein NlpD
MRSGAVLAALAAALSALLAGCASNYKAPVVERDVNRNTPVIARPSALAAEQRPDSYAVKRGDTLYSIALDNGLDYKELAAWNGITDPSVLATGQVLSLRAPQPAAGAQAAQEPAVEVKAIAVPGAIEARPLGAEAPAAPAANAALLKTGPKAMKLPYSEDNLALMQRDAQKTASAAETGAKPEAAVPAPAPTPAPAAAAGAVAAADADAVDWSWPAKGKVLAGFSEATNKGVDITGKIGDPVYASAAGRVVYSGAGLRGYGKLIIIKHNQTYLSAYAHNSNLLVKEGQTVTKGQKIAEIGNTDSDQAKLHFEIRRLGKPVDPMKFLPNRPS